MANTLRPLDVVALGAGFVTIYTVPAGIVGFTNAVIHLCETTGFIVGVYVCLVPAAGSPAAGNSLLWNFGLSANGVLELARGQIWKPGSSLQAKGLGATLHLSGIETT